MTIEELNAKVDQAKEENDKGNVDNGLRLIHEVVAELDSITSIDTEPTELRGVRARAQLIFTDVEIQRGNYSTALVHAHRALDLSSEPSLILIQARVQNAIGVVYENLGNYEQALEYYIHALSTFEELGNEHSAAFVMANIGLVYLNLGTHEQAFEYLSQALSALEELGEIHGVAVITGNIGNVYASLRKYDQALEYMGRALAAHKELGEKPGVALITGNIGAVYAELGNYDQALEYMGRALAVNEELGEKSEIARVTGNIGGVYARQEFAGNDSVKAEEYMLNSVSMFVELGALRELYEVHKSLASMYKQQKRWEEFSIHFEKYHQLKDDVHSENAKKQARLIEQQKQLTAERAAAQATTELLHKVLPSSVANRLIKGEKVADYFQHVSILFADIVGFTPIAARMPAKSVLAFLNYVFNEFDRIMEKHGCQKIKTIGDGYMAVCGAPEQCDDHAERMAGAALDLMNDITLPESLRSSLPKGSVFHLRIGLHTGSAFAGIVGEKGFVYDVYSDAVNLASRMESSGEPGRIHCSEEFAYHLQNRVSRDSEVSLFHFEERGEIEVKGKGKMRTYFLERV